MSHPIEEPFASDRDFWTSVRTSGDALVTILIASALTAALGTWWALTFLLPAALLTRAAVTGRASARRSRELFASRVEWRDAERRAVASAFFPAVLRRAAGPRG